MMKFNPEDYALLETLVRSAFKQGYFGSAGHDKLRIGYELLQKLQMQLAVGGTYLHELNMLARLYLHTHTLPEDERTRLEALCKRMKRTLHSFR